MVSYGWVTAGVADAGLVRERGAVGSGDWELRVERSAWDFEALAIGAWGGGVVDGPKSDHSTYRGEAFGLLATLVFVDGMMKRGEWRGRLQHRLDNEAVVLKYNKDGKMATAYQRHEHSDPDVWAALYALKAIVGSRVQVMWQRSHPERRKAKAAWDRHDRGNDWSDAQADYALAAFDPVEERLQLVAPDMRRWGVAWLGQPVVSDVRKSMLAALKADKQLAEGALA